jgi:hypothetical protein
MREYQFFESIIEKNFFVAFGRTFFPFLWMSTKKQLYLLFESSLDFFQYLSRAKPSFILINLSFWTFPSVIY